MAIDLRPTEDQVLLTDGVAAVLRDRFPTTRFARNPAADSGAWSLIAELGWLGLGVSAEHGGADLDITDQVLAGREFGKHLLPPALSATILAARIAASSGNRELCRALVAGETKAAYGIPAADCEITAERVSGTFQIIDGAAAAVVLVLNESGVALVDAKALQIEALEALDDASALHRAKSAGVRPLAMAKEDEREALHLLLVAQLAGIAEATTARAAEYAQNRVQFGKPIGVFQGVAHMCADNAMRAEAAYAQLAMAAVAMRQRSPDRTFQIAAASHVGAEAAIENAYNNIQVHGGMGFSAECDAHLFLKRALVLRQICGACGPMVEQLLAPDATRDANPVKLAHTV